MLLRLVKLVKNTDLFWDMMLEEDALFCKRADLFDKEESYSFDRTLEVGSLELVLTRLLLMRSWLGFFC